MFYYKRILDKKVVSIQTSLLCLKTDESFIEVTEEEFYRLSEELDQIQLEPFSDEITPEEFLQLIEENF